VILAFHRRATSDNNNTARDDSSSDGGLDSIIRAPSELQDRPRPMFARVFRTKYRFIAPFAVSLLLLAGTGLIIVGGNIALFRFKFLGAMGMVLDYLGKSIYSDYLSLIGIGTNFPQSTEIPHAIEVVSIQAFIYTFSFIVPLCHLLMVVFLWVAPLQPTSQRRILVVSEIVNAWSTLDVLTLSVILALFQIRQFVQYLITDKCDVINAFLKVYFNGPLQGDDKCFDVIAEMSPTGWVLIVGCVVYLFGVNFTVALSRNALQKLMPKQQNNTALEVN